MKKTTLILMFLMMFCSSSFASPLMDYSPGKTALDFSVHSNTQLDVSSFKAHSSSIPIEWGITVGLDGKFALQYQQFSLMTNQGDPTSQGSLRPASQNFKEMNLLYKIDKNLSVFVGALRHTYHTTDGYYDWTAPTVNAFQGGLVGVAELGNGFSAYGVVAAGTKSARKYEVGLSYAILPELDIDVYYKDQKVLLSNPDCNRVKGMGYGITYKF